MSRPVEVVVSDLHLAAGRLRDAGQRLQDGLSGVDLETRELLGSGWQGGAATAFSTAWEQWHNGAGQVVRGVQIMADLLRVAGDQYARTDEQGAGALASASFPESGAGGGAGSADTGVTAQPSTGASSGSSGSSDAVAPVGQVGQVGGQVASGLVRSGPTAGAMVAQAAQAAAAAVQQVGQTIEQAVEKAVATAKDAEERDGAAPGDDGPTTAPVEPTADAQMPGREVPR